MLRHWLLGAAVIAGLFGPAAGFRQPRPNWRPPSCSLRAPVSPSVLTALWKPSGKRSCPRRCPVQSSRSRQRLAMSSKRAKCWHGSTRGRRNRTWPPATHRSSPRAPRSKWRPRNSTARSNFSIRTTRARPRSERAEAQFKATQAQVAAQLAQAGAARAQSGFFVVKAPYGGVVSEVPITLGDMAMPGRALLTIYDPAALRVTAAVPQTHRRARIASGKPTRIQFPGLPADRQWLAPTRVTLVPTAIRAPTPGRSGSTFPRR